MGLSQSPSKKYWKQFYLPQSCVTRHFCLTRVQGTVEKYSRSPVNPWLLFWEDTLMLPGGDPAWKLLAHWTEARPCRALLDFSVLEFGFAVSLLLRWKVRLPSGNPMLRFSNTRSIFVVVTGATDGAKELPEWPGWICKAIGDFPYLSCPATGRQGSFWFGERAAFPKGHESLRCYGPAISPGTGSSGTKSCIRRLSVADSPDLFFLPRKDTVG